MQRPLLQAGYARAYQKGDALFRAQDGVSQSAFSLEASAAEVKRAAVPATLSSVLALLKAMAPKAAVLSAGLRK